MLTRTHDPEGIAERIRDLISIRISRPRIDKIVLEAVQTPDAGFKHLRLVAAFELGKFYEFNVNEFEAQRLPLEGVAMVQDFIDDCMYWLRVARNEEILLVYGTEKIQAIDAEAN